MSRGEGRHYRFQHLEFWAETGMISLVDTEIAADSASTKQSHWRIPPGEFMKRAIAALMQDPELYASKAAELRKMVNDAKEACKLAKMQGDPTDPSVLDHVVRHQRKRTIVMPHELPAMPGQAPLKIKGKGRTPADTLSAGVTVTPDLTLGASNMITPQRATAIQRARANRR